MQKIHFIHHGIQKATAVYISSGRPAASADPVAELSVALGSSWTIERQTDCMGEVSVIILPAEDDETKPTFILYEKGGLAHVGTVRNDKWESDRSFNMLGHAVAAIIGLCGREEQKARASERNGVLS